MEYQGMTILKSIKVTKTVYKISSGMKTTAGMWKKWLSGIPDDAVMVDIDIDRVNDTNAQEILRLDFEQEVKDDL